MKELYYDGEWFFEENESHPLEGFLTDGDFDRLYHIAQMNNLTYRDIASIISFVLREYYKEHNVKEFIRNATGKDYKEYEEFLDRIHNMGKNTFRKNT